MSTSIVDERLPRVTNLRKKYSDTLEQETSSRCINISGMARSVGIGRQQMYNILKGRSYPSLKTHTKINQFLKLNLPYVGKYKNQ